MWLSILLGMLTVLPVCCRKFQNYRKYVNFLVIIDRVRLGTVVFIELWRLLQVFPKFNLQREHCDRNISSAIKLIGNFDYEVCFESKIFTNICFCLVCSVLFFWQANKYLESFSLDWIIRLKQYFHSVQFVTDICHW